MNSPVFASIAPRIAKEFAIPVFPLIARDKKPLISRGFHEATIDAQIVGGWADKYPSANIGVPMGEPSGIWALDLDGEAAEKWLAEQVSKHGELPVTPEVATGKGRHIYFKLRKGEEIARRVGLAEKVDVLGTGGYAIFPPSVHPNGNIYIWRADRRPSVTRFAHAPEWLVDLVTARKRPQVTPPQVIKPNVEGADKYVRKVLDSEYNALAKAQEGGRNQQLFKSVAAMANYIGQGGCTKGMVHDLAVAAAHACGLWSDDGADACLATIESAFKQGLANPKQVPERAPRPRPERKPEQAPAPKAISKEDVEAIVKKNGTDHIEQYGEVQKACEDFNKEFAVIHEGSKVGILRETIDENDSRTLSVISEKGFETLTANRLLVIDKKDVPVSKLWLKSPTRRQYDGRDFRPDGKCPPNILNLWRGFSFEPDASAGKFDRFLDHAKNNICQGNEDHYHWLMSWAADLFQKPHRKNGTAVVMRGGMGTGKGTFAHHIGKLVSRHYMATSQASQITGKFNGHMADKLLMFIDEGFWAGDKSAEGPFKNIVTEETVTVEYKGKDAIKMQSYIRFIVASNNDWVVPSGMDERRFAIFDVSDARKQDTEYFEAMKKQLQNGGYQALLHYLLRYEYDEASVRIIPKTQGLLDQKMASMSNELKWWFEVLSDGRIPEEGWPKELEKDKFHTAYINWCDKMKVRHPVGKKTLYDVIKTRAGVEMKDKKLPKGYAYLLPAIDQARAEFEKSIGHKLEWQEADKHTSEYSFGNDY